MSQERDRVDLDTSLGYLLKKTHSALRVAMDGALRPSGLSVPQYACLELLAQRPGLSNADLARSAFVTRQSMNVLLRGLQRAGLVKRASVAETGRALPAQLTAAGHRMLTDASRTIHAVEARLTSALDHDQQTQLRVLLTACVDALQPAETSTTR